MIWIIIGIVCLTLDVVTKNYISSNFVLGESIPVINNIFHITYHLNSGAAFSVLEGKRIFLVCLTFVILLALIIYIIIKKPKDKLLLMSLTLVISGAIGNLINRITTGVVVDFFDFRVINFPVFNIADSCVVIGAALLFIYTFKLEDKKHGKA